MFQYRWRLNRTLTSLHYEMVDGDGAITGFHQWGEFVASEYTTRVIVLIGRVAVYVLATAALIESFEYPCISLVSDPSRCKLEFQEFLLSVYFTIVTLATVGYGDIVPVTLAGRNNF